MKITCDIIMENLKGLPFLCDFKYRKSSPRRFYIKDKERILYVEFACNNYGGMLFLEPSYGVRYNILHKWFEKFCKRSLKDQRDSYSYAFTGKMIDNNQESFFYFDCDGKNYDDLFFRLVQEMQMNIHYLFAHYGNLQLCFQTVIEPYLRDEKQMPISGIDWAFDDLALCKLVSPEKFPTFKSMVMKHLEWLRSRDEPNVMLYGKEIENIVHYLETTDITKIR